MAPGAGLLSFVMTLVNTARFWSDNQLLLAPSTRLGQGKAGAGTLRWGRRCRQALDRGAFRGRAELGRGMKLSVVWPLIIARPEGRRWLHRWRSPFRPRTPEQHRQRPRQSLAGQWRSGFFAVLCAAIDRGLAGDVTTDQRAEPKKEPLIPSTMVCRVDERPKARRPYFQPYAIGEVGHRAT
jgi:hypothetical protein